MAMRRALIVLLLLSLLAGCRAAPANLPVASPGAGATPGERGPTPSQPGDMNILLLGSDRRTASQDPGWRTDAIIVVAIRPKDNIVAMFSIPRDLWVTIPGYGPERINAADYVGETSAGTGGAALTAATIKQNLGIPVQAYVRIQFAGLERIVDAVGGVTIDSPRVFDEWVDEGDGSAPWHFTVDSGPQHMDGRTALYYARSRQGTNDIDRSQRQQQLLLALRDAALRPQVLPHLPGMVRSLADTVQTDLRPADVLGLLNLALRLEPQAYHSRVFDASMMSDWVTPSGSMVLVPNRERIEEVWAELTAPG